MDKEKFYKQLCEEEEALIVQEKDIQDRIRAIRQLKPHYAGGKPATLFSNESEIMPSKYEKSLNQKNKAYLALKAIKHGDTDSIAQSLHSLEPEIDIEKAKKIVTIFCSALYNEGKIDAKKHGRKNIYSVK